MISNSERTIFHIDMDAFFASIEQRDFPEYRGKPVIVGAKPGTRGVVCAASYEARRFGVRSAMPVKEAFRRCPQGIFIPPRGEIYSSVSKSVMEILIGFSPVIEKVSVDEAFIDMSGTGRLFGPPLETAQKISHAINEKLALTASIGIAPNKFLSKIASDFNKPNGITITPFDQREIEKWLASLAVGKLWGVGEKTRYSLHCININTVYDLQQTGLDFLVSRFGKQGESLYYLCRGIDERPVGEGESAKSISREFTFQNDCCDKEEWKATLLALSGDVARRARRKGVKGSTVVLCYRRPDFSRHSKRLKLPCPSDLSKVIYEHGVKILSQVEENSLRLIGIGITDFEADMQTDLFSELPQTQALEASEKAVDRVIARFGKNCIRKGTQVKMQNTEITR